MNGGQSQTTTPTPGSDAAVALDCKCPVMDNERGRGINGNFWITDGCPIHAPKRVEADAK